MIITVVVLTAILLLAGASVRVGRVLSQIRQPGLTLLAPGVDRLRKVNTQIVMLPVPAQGSVAEEEIRHDNHR
jgi:hypothetical protein